MIRLDRRPSVISALVLAALIAACGGPAMTTGPAGTDGGPATTPAGDAGLGFDPSTPPPLPPPTAWEQALAEINDDGRFSLDAALTLFATAYGPLPGVDVEQDLTGVTDTSIAIRAVMAHRDELTSEQLAAVDRALAVPDGTDVVTIPPVGTARSNVTLAAFTKAQQEAMRSLVEGYRWRIATKLGRDFLGDIKLYFFEQAGPAGAGPMHGANGPAAYSATVGSASSRTSMRPSRCCGTRSWRTRRSTASSWTPSGRSRRRQWSRRG